MSAVLVGDAARHDDTAGPDGKAVDDGVVVLRRDLDGADAEFLQFLEKGKGKHVGIDDGDVDVDHRHGAVDVDGIAGEIDAQQFDALPGEHFLELARALLVDADGPADDGRAVIEPGETAAFHHARAVDGAQDRHAETGDRLRDVSLLAAADRARQAADHAASLDGDRRIAGVDGLQAVGFDAVQKHHLDTLVPQRADQTVVLGAELVPVGNRVALEVPAPVEVSERADLLDPPGAVDDLHLRPGTVHEADAQGADIVVASPLPAPHGRLPGFALEGRLRVGAEELDGLTVDARHGSGPFVLECAVFLTRRPAPGQVPSRWGRHHIPNVSRQLKVAEISPSLE